MLCDGACTLAGGPVGGPTAATGVPVMESPPRAAPSSTTPDPPAPEPKSALSRPVPFAEVRAVWVVRTTMSDPEAIRIMVDRVRLAGFNTIFVQIRGRGDSYYAERIEPPDFDPLDFVIKEAHARDLAVHAWINTYLVASATRLPTAAEHLVNAHPDFLAVPQGARARPPTPSTPETPDLFEP